MKKILFLCTGNSCRSQMAEGFCRHFHSDKYKCFSAGIEAHGVNPYAVKVMQQIGIDISGQQSKIISELPLSDFDFVITLCGHADENCPCFPACVKKFHIGFEDPAKLAQNVRENDKLAIYKCVRDEIRLMIERLPEILIEQNIIRIINRGI